MRRPQIFLCISALFTLLVLLHAFSTLIALLFEDGLDDAILSCDIPSLAEENQYGNGTAIIPKIIHQTYINDSVPEQWKEGQQACIDLHPDYEYMVGQTSGKHIFILTNRSSGQTRNRVSSSPRTTAGS